MIVIQMFFPHEILTDEVLSHANHKSSQMDEVCDEIIASLMR